ncbi:hypothetical protein Tco_0644316 [Tanacetum coccineum]
MTNAVPAPPTDPPNTRDGSRVIEQVAARSGMDSKMVELLSFKLDVLDFGTYLYKMYLKHHEKQVEDILNYLDELYLHHIEKMEEGRINGNELKTELKESYQIVKLQKKRIGQKDKISFAHYRISNFERIIEKIQARHQTNQEDL